MEQVHTAFAVMAEAQMAFYNNPTTEALAAYTKCLNTLILAMRELPAKPVEPPPPP